MTTVANLPTRNFDINWLEHFAQAHLLRWASNVGDWENLNSHIFNYNFK
jgi:hypothetical protein